MAKHLEDFMDLSAGELKFFLQQRALPCTGTHSDLAARCLVAFEQKIPTKESAEQYAQSLKTQHEATLQKYSIQQDPIEIVDWEEDLTKWPKTNIGQIFSYILSSKAFSTDYIGQYKVRKAYSFFKSGFVHQIVTKSLLNGNILLYSHVTPSQRVREQPHKTWVVCNSSGDVLCAYCSCTAGYSKCCNHVVAVLYKVEYANEKGYTSPSCTDQACAWNKSTKDIEPRKVKDMNFESHKRGNPTPKFSINGNVKRNFDPRPSIHKDISDMQKEQFLQSVRQLVPDAVINISYKPPVEEDVPPPLPELAELLIDKHADENEDNLIVMFSEQLSFNDASLKELEKATRGQSSKRAWVEQRKGRITASNFHDVYTKVKTLLRMRGQTVKTKVSPLLAKMLYPADLSDIPAIKWGRQNEKSASEAFFYGEGKKHNNPKLIDCGLIVPEAYPFLGASPDNIFVCSCCGPACVEYKCPYSIKDHSVKDDWAKTDFLEEIDGKIQLKRSHKYYFQVQGQMGISGYHKTYFCVWTSKGDLFLEVIQFDIALWNDIVAKLIVFFKSYLQRVMLHVRPLAFCLTCEKVCLEPDEFDECEHNSINCECCDMWYHWNCVGYDGCEATFVCESCKLLAIDTSI